MSTPLPIIKLTPTPKQVNGETVEYLVAAAEAFVIDKKVAV